VLGVFSLSLGTCNIQRVLKGAYRKTPAMRRPVPPPVHHSWETRAKKQRWDRPTELRDECGYWGEASDSDSEDEQNPGAEFVEHMLRLHLCNKISAADCCTSMWWAAQAGIKEAVQYAMAPGSASGHCSRKLRKEMGIDESDDLYRFAVPGHGKHDLSRSLHDCWCMPMHEQVAEDLAADASCRADLLEARRTRALPDVYWQHPVVKRHCDRPVLPLAIYIDAVPFSLTDSVLGFWAVNLLSKRRYLWATLRKSQSCKCGCRGWCSYVQFFQLAAWSLQSLADGQWPSHRHDGSQWWADDAKRQARAGEKMMMPGAVLFVKGDWSEYCGTLGFPQWQDGLRPCFLCNACGPAMYIASGNTEDCLRWRENEAADYTQACDRATIRVHVPDENTRARIAARLRYDKRPIGC
jgi:hypothetical protein